MERKDSHPRLELLQEGQSSERTTQHSGESSISLNEYLSRATVKRTPMVERTFLLTPEETSEFFECISNDSKQNANRLLSKYEKEVIESKWTQGYLDALKGMVHSLENDKHHTPFLLRIREKDGNGIQDTRKEFAERIERRFTGEYDRGFLTAWMQYLSVLLLYK